MAPSLIIIAVLLAFAFFLFPMMTGATNWFVVGAVLVASGYILIKVAIGGRPAAGRKRQAAAGPELTDDAPDDEMEAAASDDS